MPYSGAALAFLALVVVTLPAAACSQSGQQSLQQLSSTSDFEGYPDWSPNGRSIAFVRWTESDDTRTWETWVMRSDGSEETKLGKGWAAKFSPDGTRLVYALPTASGDGAAICAMKTDGTQTTTLVDYPGSTCAFPTWSPDGAKVSFIRDGRLWLANADGSGGMLLMEKDQVGEVDAGVHSWSPDGTMIAFERWNVQTQQTDIWIVDVDGTDMRQLTSDGRSMMPDWSPDGTRIAFKTDFAESDGTYSRCIDVINPDGSDRETVLAARDHADWKVVAAPSWSADGRKLAFDVVYKSSGDIDVWALTLVSP